jgi:RimJ/RimL family protein N-acetyltransferase
MGPADLAGFIQRRYDGHAIYSVFTAGPPGHQVFVGTTGITEIQADVERVKIGRTVLDPRVWGSRANHEVKIALMDWLFSCGAGRIECDVDPRNQRSLRSLARFGFTVEGVRRRSSPRVDGSWRDIVVLSLLVEEWPQARAQAVAALMEYVMRRMAA